MALSPNKRHLYSIAKNNLSELVEHTKLSCEVCTLLLESQITTKSETDELKGFLDQGSYSKGASYMYERILCKIDGVSACEEKFLGVLSKTGNWRALLILQYTSSGMSRSFPGMKFAVPNERIVHGLPNCDPDFIGRSKELSCLHEWYKEAKKPILVSGLGGIGKSCLVRRFVEIISAEASQPEFNIIWINGGRNQLQNSVLSIFCEEYTQYFAIENFKMALEKYIRQASEIRRTLLIVDNLEQMCDYLYFICSPIPSVSVVVISRNVSILDASADALNLSDLANEDALNLFHQISAQDNINGNAIPRLCSVLQNFPLSLIEVANYIGLKRKIKPNYNVDIFLDDFSCLRKKTEVLNEYLPISRKANYNFSTISTWDRTVRDICNLKSEVSKIALLLLKTLSYGCTQRIKEQDFYNISDLNSVANQGIWNVSWTVNNEIEYCPSDIQDGFEMLAKFSLLEYEKESPEHYYKIHKVLQTVTRLKSPQQWRPLSSFVSKNTEVAQKLRWEICSGQCLKCGKDCLPYQRMEC